MLFLHVESCDDLRCVPRLTVRGIILSREIGTMLKQLKGKNQ